MTLPPPADLLDRVREAAWAAGAEIMKLYRGDYAVRHKADSSPVTEADEAAEAVILPALAALLPGVPAVAEEMMSAGAEVDVAGGPFWLVDPLDGTREFLDRSDEFTVNIALIASGQPVLGVVHVPARGDTYAAAGPGTATRQRASGASEPIACRAAPEAGVVVVASRRHGDQARLDAMLGEIKVADFATAGSSLKFCLVAEGAADLYPRFGATMEWDTAAGHAVLAAAGGSVRTLDGAELAYGKPGFLNPEFIARGRER